MERFTPCSGMKSPSLRSAPAKGPFRLSPCVSVLRTIQWIQRVCRQLSGQSRCISQRSYLQALRNWGRLLARDTSPQLNRGTPSSAKQKQATRLPEQSPFPHQIYRPWLFRRFRLLRSMVSVSTRNHPKSLITVSAASYAANGATLSPTFASARDISLFPRRD